MAITGKIAPIKRQFSDQINTIDQQLSKHGYTRFPGTSEMFLPFKEQSGRYRTGLDPQASYLNRLSPEEKEAEVKRITETKERLEKLLGVAGILSPTSLYWNFAASPEQLKQAFGSDQLRVSPIKLGNSEEFFDTNDIVKEITWNWMKVHPRVAPSLDAWKRGDVSAEVKYYVVDDEAEQKDTFNRKKEINKAIVAFEDMTPTKQKQIARLMGLPVTESTKEEVVYNLLDSKLKEAEFKDGEHKGLSPVRLFNDLLTTSDTRIRVKDLVKQAKTHSIYREGAGGKMLEGAVAVANSEQELVDFLLDDKNNLDLIALEKKLQIKKIEKA